VTSLDQATQQNAALVEEMAAAASSLKSQAQDLVQAVAVFKLDSSTSVVKTTVRAPKPSGIPFKGSERRAITSGATPHRPAPAKSATPQPRTQPTATPKPVASAKASVAAAASDEWETF
jgi:hypothetical protein